MNTKSENLGVCSHLKPLKDHIESSGGKITYQGQAWSERCRQWIYFDVVLDCEKLKIKLNPDSCVKIHEHIGTHDGQEKGFVCDVHQDGIMGIHPKFATNEKQIG